MTVVYHPGKHNHADYLSKHIDPHLKAYRAEMEGEEYANFVAINELPKAITFAVLPTIRDYHGHLRDLRV